MKKFLIFTDRRGRRWICGQALRVRFNMSEPTAHYFWDYDELANALDKKRRPTK